MKRLVYWSICFTIIGNDEETLIINDLSRSYGAIPKSLCTHSTFPRGSAYTVYTTLNVYSDANMSFSCFSEDIGCEIAQRETRVFLCASSWVEKNFFFFSRFAMPSSIWKSIKGHRYFNLCSMLLKYSFFLSCNVLHNLNYKISKDFDLWAIMDQVLLFLKDA